MTNTPARDTAFRSKLNEQATYNPNRLFDTFIELLSLKNDAALARKLGTTRPRISSMRNGRLSIGPTVLINMHEISGLPIKELRALMGDHRERFSVICVVPLSPPESKIRSD